MDSYAIHDFYYITETGSLQLIVILLALCIFEASVIYFALIKHVNYGSESCLSEIMLSLLLINEIKNIVIHIQARCARIIHVY